MSDDRYTEGICDDGAAILYDGLAIPVEEVIRLLNARQELVDQCESMKRERDHYKSLYCHEAELRIKYTTPKAGL